MKTKLIIIMLFLTNKIVGAENYSVRPFSKQDIPQLTNIIRLVRAEFGFGPNHPDYKLLEEDLEHTFDIYDGHRNNYFVIEYNSKIVGGCGYAILSDKHNDVCEIKCMYLLPETRGLGLGSILLNNALEDAKAQGFKKCYLETNDFMHGANALYKKFGFQELKQPFIEEHKWSNCYYIKDLQ